MVFHASLFCVALLMCNLLPPCHVVANSRECVTCFCAHLAVWMYLICRAHAHVSHLTSSNERAFTLIRSFAASCAPEFFLHHSRVDKIWADWQSQGVAFMNAYVARAKAPRCTAQSENSFLFPSHGFLSSFFVSIMQLLSDYCCCSHSNGYGGRRALIFLGRGCLLTPSLLIILRRRTTVAHRTTHCSREPTSESLTFDDSATRVRCNGQCSL